MNVVEERKTPAVRCFLKSVLQDAELLVARYTGAYGGGVPWSASIPGKGVRKGRRITWQAEVI